jgi:diguanylate cyclase (GGDEF)-like protein/PAS domain S-box-containing protein
VLDLKTVMKGTAAISREIDLNRLLTVVMRIVIENAGAQSGLLLRPADGTWTVVASGKIGTDEVAIPQANRPVEADDLALGVARFVARTRQRVVLDDAHSQGDFVDDPYVVRTGTRSLLCAPLLTRGRLGGVLYLENNLTTHAFTAQRVQLLEMVLTPAATALENADAYEALRVSEAKYRQIVDTTTEGIWMLDRDGRTTFVNARMAGMLGLDPAEAIGRPMSDFLVDVHAGEDLAARPDEAGKPHLPPADGAYEPRHLECRLRRKDSQVLWGLTSTALILDAQYEVEGSLTMVTDITDRKNAEDTLAYKAHHDDLTGLPNRARLMELLHSALARALRTGTRIGLLFIDLDDFKSVNDSFGHTGGDEFLIQVADRITHMLRETDAAARIGGDEFVVVCENLTDTADATIVAQRVQSALDNGVQIRGRKVGAPASIGIAISNEYTTAEEMLRDADAAMYAAKRRGGRIWSSADPLVHTTALRMLALEANLREAVRLGQLRLHYQPTFDLRTGLMVGVEALLRWEHPSRGLLLPKELIEVAERRNLIGSIGTWVLRTACAQASAWIRRFGSRAPVVAVNISTRQLGEQELSRQVRQLLADNDLPPDRLCLEITESQFISVGSSAINNRTLSRPASRSPSTTGTGFSGFDYLRRLPVDTLKIDKSYVDGLGHDQTDTAIVASIVALAHNLGLITIAEGIETPVQRDTLREHGCSVGQGWLWHPALPAQELEHLLEARQVNDDDCDPGAPAERDSP